MTQSDQSTLQFLLFTPTIQRDFPETLQKFAVLIFFLFLCNPKILQRKRANDNKEKPPRAKRLPTAMKKPTRTTPAQGSSESQLNWLAETEVLLQYKLETACPTAASGTPLVKNIPKHRNPAVLTASSCLVRNSVAIAGHIRTVGRS